MNRRDFMDALERQLYDVPLEERIDALQYYEDYFEDAGFEKEQDIINELKSPEDVANIIKKDLGINTENTQSRSEYKDYRNEYAGKNDTAQYRQENAQYNQDNAQYNQDNAQYNQDNPQYRYDNSQYNQMNDGVSGSVNAGNNTAKIDRKIWIIIFICTLPVTAGPILGFFGAFFGIIIGIFAFCFGMYAGAVGCAIGAVALFVTGTISVAVLVLGIAFLLFAAALLTTLLCSVICRVIIPSVFGGIKKMWLYFFGKGEAVA